MNCCQSEGRFARHHRDWVNIISSITGPLVFFYPFYHGFDGSDELAIYIVLLLVWIADLNYLLHLHVHRPFTTSAAFNRLIDMCLGSVSGMTSANWRIQHVFGHHRGHDGDYTHRSLDWAMERYSVRGALAYSFGNIAITYWQPIRESYLNGVLAHVRDPIDYRSAFVEQMGFILMVATLAIWQPVLTCFFLLPWQVMIFAMTRYVDYLNHYGCSDEGMNFANNCLSRSFTTLPQLHGRIADQIPPERIKTFDWSSALMPYHAWREHRAGL